MPKYFAMASLTFWVVAVGASDQMFQCLWKVPCDAVKAVVKDVKIVFSAPLCKSLV